jgi:hypothetical protein
LTSVPDITLTAPPEAETDTLEVGFVPVLKRSVPVTVTVVAVPAGPEFGEGPLVTFGTATANVPGALAVSPSERRVTAIAPPLLGHPAGGLARI